MFQTVRLSIISSLFTVHSAMVYVIQVCRQLSSRSICSCSKAVYKPVWHIPLLSVQWINSWWRTDELPETCRVSCQNKFVKLVQLVGFIIKKFVTMHGHMLRCTVTCHDARSHVTMHGHMNVKFVLKIICHEQQTPVFTGGEKMLVAVLSWYRLHWM